MTIEPYYEGRLLLALERLEKEAKHMEKTCLHPPCAHAWGIAHSLEEIRTALDLPHTWPILEGN